MWVKRPPAGVVDTPAMGLDPRCVRLFALLSTVLVISGCQVPEPILSSTEQLAVLTTPATSFTFASTEVGVTSAPTSILVRPAGNPSLESYDEVTAVTASCPDFVVTASGLPAAVYRTVICDTCGGGTCQVAAAAPICYTDEYVTYSFDAAFRPTIAGSTSCVVTITTNGSTTRTVTLFGTGTVPPIDIDVQPTSVAFGDVRRNTASTPATISVRNLGGSPLSISSVTVSPATFAITSGPVGGTTVSAGGMQPYAVTCNPTAVGGITGMVRVNSNDPTTPVVNVPVSCNGIDSNLDISPSPSAITTTRVGEPRTHTITLTNSGTASMTIQSVALTGTDLTMVTTPPAGTILAAGASTMAQVRFGATASGDVSGMAVVTYDGAQVRSVPITARALSTSMALTPDGAVDLGPVCVGQMTDQTFTIIANDQASFRINTISTPDAPFALAAPTLPLTVQGAGASMATFDVTVSPTTAGPVAASMMLTTDIPGAAPRTIELRAEGLPAGLSGTPALLDFGSSPLEVTTLGEQVSITNCSTSPVTLTNARLEGTDASEFAIVLPPSSLTVPPSSTLTWLVVMAPRAVGVKQAQFTVDHPDGSVSVEISGEGLGELAPTEPVEPGKGSYYGCSASGSAAHAWPLALLFVLVLRRRRRR